MTPELARFRNLSYSAPLTINMKMIRTVRTLMDDGTIEEDTKIEYLKNINFGKIPIMVQSPIVSLASAMAHLSDKMENAHMIMAATSLLAAMRKSLLARRGLQRMSHSASTTPRKPRDKK